MRIGLKKTTNSEHSTLLHHKCEKESKGHAYGWNPGQPAPDYFWRL